MNEIPGTLHFVVCARKIKESIFQNSDKNKINRYRPIIKKKQPLIMKWLMTSHFEMAEIVKKRVEKKTNKQLFFFRQ